MKLGKGAAIWQRQSTGEGCGSTIEGIGNGRYVQ